MSQHYWLTLSVATVLALGLAGCDSVPQKLAPVSGTVLLDGEPLVGASVNTQPISTSSNLEPGSGSFGNTDDQGHYSLELVDPPLAGAVVGEHRVTITQREIMMDQYDDSDEIDEIVRPPQGPPWPNRYSDGTLRLTVPPEGTTEANFELTLKK